MIELVRHGWRGSKRRGAAMAKQGLQLFGGDWTERKLDALQQYLRAYAQALKKQPFQRWYLDAFAGTGYREQRATHSLPDIFAEELMEAEPRQFLDGSPRIALKIEPPFHRYLFIELDPARAQELQQLRQEFPHLAGAIEIAQTDCNAVIQDVCARWDRHRWRGVLFLDPFGMQIEWSTVEAVASTGCIDVWILFPLAANRLLTRHPQDIPLAWRNRLNTTFGSPDWEARFYRGRTVTDMFSGDELVIEKALTMKSLGDYYGERLQKIFPVVATNPALLRNTRNAPLFQLFFAAANSGKGGQIALRIAQHILTNI